MPVNDSKGNRSTRTKEAKCRNGSIIPLTETTMSDPRPYLPPELLDFIVDLLCDELETLEKCCLVSKSWVPRTRTYLFADIKFESLAGLEAWKRIFPDPSNSPAYYTRSLFVRSLKFVTAEEGGWIRAFSNVVRLEVWSGIQNVREPSGSLIPFYDFSPVLKSLRVASTNLPPSQVLGFVCSSPLLEDLIIRCYGMGNDEDDGTIFRPSTSPALTGTLEIYLPHGMEHTARQLLDLPDGLHFRKLEFAWCLEEDLRWMVDLVTGCSDTLECIDIEYCLSRTSLPPPRRVERLAQTSVCSGEFAGSLDRL
jgi:hypothetical protein